MLNNPGQIPDYIYEYLQGLVRGVEPIIDSSAVQLIGSTNLKQIQVLIESFSLDTGQIVDEQTDLAVLNPVNQIEIFYKQVLKIRLNAALSLGSNTELADALTVDESGFLDSLVFEVPYESSLGSSILAQSVLGITYVPDDWVMSVAPKTANIPSEPLRVYPNPVSSMGIVTNITEDATVVRVVNTLGKVVLLVPVRGNSIVLDLTMLPSGLYIVDTDSQKQRSSVTLLRR